MLFHVTGLILSTTAARQRAISIILPVGHDAVNWAWMGVALNKALQVRWATSTMHGILEDITHLQKLTATASSVTSPNIIPVTNLACNWALSDLAHLFLEVSSFARRTSPLVMHLNKARSCLKAGSTRFITVRPLDPVIPDAVNSAGQQLAFPRLRSLSDAWLTIELHTDLLPTRAFLRTFSASNRARAKA
jgi:hypothetical protein